MKYYDFIDYHINLTKKLDYMGSPNRYEPIKKGGKSSRKNRDFKYNKFFIKCNQYKTKYYKLIW